ncbi:MAG: LacI family transcriptional regulator [Phycicoccus sp.]|nr:LacI family transcriptional regulator [Phycicoccus sp.]NMM34717.1 LacI family transcriptional regulator [Phycicoccus sp.]
MARAKYDDSRTKVAPDTHVNLREIADLAGVSVPTVSKVLNGRQGVSEVKRDAINTLLEEHGYRRRGTDRRSRIGLVDLLISGLGSMWSLEIVSGAAEEAARAGVGLVISQTTGRRVGNQHWLRQLASRRTDGIVLVVSQLLPGAADALARLNTPLVLVDPVGDAALSIPSVAATNWAGGLAATEHLLALGHRRIGAIAGPAGLRCSEDRLDGYRVALQRAGVMPDPALVRFGDFLVGGGRVGGTSLLALADPPTAIFAGSDQQAHGVYLAAAARGLRIPDDVSVVGFDDVALCEWISPTLTTVRQPLAEMAAEATRLVLSLSSNGDSPVPPRRELATSLIVRESTAPPRSL